MQLKARVLAVEAQDYRTDRVEDGDIRRTQRKSTQEEYESIDIDGYALQAFASQDHLHLASAAHLPVNHYLLLRNAEEPTHGVPARHVGGGAFRKLRHEHISIRNGRSLVACKPRGRGFSSMLSTIQTSRSSPSTGRRERERRFLASGSALEQVQTGEYEKMLITRVIMPTGRDIGFLPGKT
jgi:PhoH-like ATPase